MPEVNIDRRNSASSVSQAAKWLRGNEAITADFADAWAILAKRPAFRFIVIAGSLWHNGSYINNKMDGVNTLKLTVRLDGHKLLVDSVIRRFLMTQRTQRTWTKVAAHSCPQTKR